MKTKKPVIYIMANQTNGTIYIGVTFDLSRRIFEHKNGHGSEFVKKYRCTLLVWYQFFELMIDAISFEKSLKKKLRKSKIKLIETMNPDWNDLYENVYHQ